MKIDEEIGARISVSIPVSKKFLGDILVTAVESRYDWYWGWDMAGQGVFLDETLEKNGSVTIHLEDPNNSQKRNAFYINYDILAMALQWYVNFQASRGRDIIPDDNWDFDANDADCIIQYACYREIIFG